MPYLNDDGSYAATPSQSPVAPGAPTPGGLPGQTGPVTKTGYQPPPYTGDAGAWIQQVIQGLGLQANQSDPTALKTIVQLAQQVGAPIAMDQVDSNGHLGGLIINGQKMQLIDGSNNWTSPQPWSNSQAVPSFSPPPMLDLGGPQGISYIPPTPTFAGANAPPTFTPPSVGEAMNDPGFQFREQQGESSLQNWAAAKGTLNDSSTAKALTDYGQNAASQEYQNVWNRDYNAFGTNYKTWADSVLNPTLMTYGLQANAGANQNNLNYQNGWNKYTTGLQYYAGPPQ